jgi:glycosyltransferase involved in cell wall biosynthesis
MVKDEEKRIHFTLSNATKYAREVVIYDTGSSDNTLNIIKEFANVSPIKFHILCGDFVDYSTSRNVMLEYCETLCRDGELIMVLDCNDELRADNFDANISKIPNNINGVMVNSYWEFSDERNTMSHIKFLLLRAHRNVRYRGRVHEYMMENGNEFKSYYFLEEAYLHQDRTQDDDKTRKRYNKDIELLLKEIEDDPVYVMRHYFYLGKTYMLKGDYTNAFKYLKKRISIESGDTEEIHMSYIYLGMITYARIDQANKSNLLYLMKYDSKRHYRKMVKFFLEAYNAVPRAEPLTYLIKYYTNTNDWNLAYLYSKRMCVMELPPHAHSFNIKAYKFERWFYMAVVCFNLQKFDEGVAAFKNIDYSLCTDSELQKYREVETKYNMLAFNTNANTSPAPPVESNKKIVLIACGAYWHKWDGELKDSNRGIGGSELVAIKNAEFLANKGYSVYFCCDCEKQKQINNVVYIPLYEYDSFINTHLIDVLYVYRIASMIRFNNIKSVYLSMEDVSFVGDLKLKPGISKKIICKSEWQKAVHIKSFPQIADMFTVIGNGIDACRFANVPEWKDKQNKFIYSSCPLRGLDNLLRMFPKIKQVMPDASLTVFIDVVFTDYRDNKAHVMNLYEMMKQMDGVIVSPRVSQTELANEISNSKYWLYPTKFSETYCITAHEMMAGRVACIYHKLAALNDTVGERGWGIDGDDDDKYIDTIMEISTNPETNDRVNKAREWALFNDWDFIGQKIYEMIDN